MSHTTSASDSDVASDGDGVAGATGPESGLAATADRERREPVAQDTREPVPQDTREPVQQDTREPVAQGTLDRLARRVLGLRDAEPRALMDLQGSLVLSAVRCLITYVFIPIALPAIAWAGIVARPLGFALAVVAVAMSIRSLRRVWQANWTHRWAYTAFIAVVVGLLVFSIVLDLRFFLA